MGEQVQAVEAVLGMFIQAQLNAQKLADELCGARTCVS